MIIYANFKKSSSSIKQQGNCEKCGSSISLRKRFCEKCTAEAKEEAFLKKNHILRFMGPNGEYRKQLPNVFSSGHFTFNKPYQIKFDLSSPANDIIEHLLGLVFDKTKYVSESDRHWLMAMLIHLSESKLTYYKSGAKKVISFLDVSVGDIVLYLHNWIMSFFQEDQHPLLPTYAVATTKFIGEHLFGTSWYSDDGYRCDLEAWIDENSRTRALDSFLIDKGFKKAFTEKMGNIIVSCSIPDNIKLASSIYVDSKRKDIEIDKNFDLLYSRCYLSENVYHTNVCEILGLNPIKFDIFSDFELPGEILYSPKNNRNEFRRLGTKIPVKWAVGVKLNGPDSEIVYLPKWLKDN